MGGAAAIFLIQGVTVALLLVYTLKHYNRP